MLRDRPGLAAEAESGKLGSAARAQGGGYAVAAAGALPATHGPEGNVPGPALFSMGLKCWVGCLVHFPVLGMEPRAEHAIGGWLPKTCSVSHGP